MLRLTNQAKLLSNGRIVAQGRVLNSFNRTSTVSVRFYAAKAKKSKKAAAATAPASLDQYAELIKEHEKLISKLPHGKQVEEAEKLYEFSKGLVDKLQKTPEVPEDKEKKLLNELIETFTKHNYGVAILALRQLEKKLKMSKKEELLSSAALAELIKHNPGRNSTSWELFEKYGKTGAEDALKLLVLRKLIHGDKAEVKEGKAASKVDLNKAIKVFLLLKGLSSQNIIKPEDFLKLAEDLISSGLGKSLLKVALPVEVVKKILEAQKKKGEEVKPEDAFHLFQSAKAHGGIESIPSDLLEAAILPISKVQLNKHRKSTDNYELLKSLSPSIKAIKDEDPSTVASQIAAELQKRGLDKEFPVMVNLIKAYGFYGKDAKKANELFQKYQTKLPAEHPGQNKLKTAIALVFAYKAIHDNDSKLIEVAKALIPQKPKPSASNLASLILAHSWFGDKAKSLETYNKALGLFLKPKSDPKNVAARGKLIHALILATLLHDELGLARFIKTKAVENKLLSHEDEKKTGLLFKHYGKAKEDAQGDHVLFRRIMLPVVLEAVRELAPKV